VELNEWQNILFVSTYVPNWEPLRECKVVVVLKLTLTLRFHPQQHYQDSFVA